jgi:hypothetical protein
MKLILENWRKYLKEEEDLATTVPRKGKKIKAAKSEPMPVEKLLPTFFEVLLKDPETFDLVPEEVKGKSFEEIKNQAHFADFMKDMKEEIGDLLASFSNIPGISKYLKDGYDRKNFLKFIQELPDEEKSHVLTSIAAMSEKFSSGTVALIATAPNEIKVYACLFNNGIDPKNILDEEFHKCRVEAGVSIEEGLQKI